MASFVYSGLNVYTVSEERGGQPAIKKIISSQQFAAMFLFFEIILAAEAAAAELHTYIY